MASPNNIGKLWGFILFCFPSQRHFWHLLACTVGPLLHSGTLSHPGGNCGWGPFHNWMYSATSWPRYSLQRLLVCMTVTRAVSGVQQLENDNLKPIAAGPVMPFALYQFGLSGSALENFLFKWLYIFKAQVAKVGQNSFSLRSRLKAAGCARPGAVTICFPTDSLE